MSKLKVSAIHDPDNDNEAITVDTSGNVTVSNNLDVSSGTIKLDGNYPVGTGNVALGNGTFNSASFTGLYNTAVGGNALNNSSTASNNTALGYYALQSNTTGGSNISVGVNALRLNTTGNYNTALGTQALRFSTTASNNTAVGYQAGYSNTTGISSVFVGWQAGYSNTTALQNTYVGQYAGHSTTGNNNTFIGGGSGYNMTTGTKNTILGSYNGNQDGLDIRTSSNRIVLSDGDGTPFAYGSKQTGAYGTRQWVFGGYNITPVGSWAETVIIGDTYSTGGYALAIESQNYAVRFGHKTNVSTNDAYVGSITLTGSATSYNTSSDYRLKENVVAMSGATERLKQLNPVRFNFISDADKTVDGFLAHEAAEVVPEAVHGTKDGVDADGNPEYQGIDQSKLVPLLVATIQELEARITALESA